MYVFEGKVGDVSAGSAVKMTISAGAGMIIQVIRGQGMTWDDLGNRESLFGVCFVGQNPAKINMDPPPKKLEVYLGVT